MTSELNSPAMDRDGSDGGDDDDISITSTIDEPEGDFDVEELLHERVNPHNPDEIQYLIKWENYPYDQCTVSPGLCCVSFLELPRQCPCLPTHDPDFQTQDHLSPRLEMISQVTDLPWTIVGTPSAPRGWCIRGVGRNQG